VAERILAVPPAARPDTRTDRLAYRSGESPNLKWCGCLAAHVGLKNGRWEDFFPAGRFVFNRQAVFGLLRGSLRRIRRSAYCLVRGALSAATCAEAGAGLVTERAQRAACSVQMESFRLRSSSIDRSP
jgi:hypothetical protein